MPLLLTMRKICSKTLTKNNKQCLADQTKISEFFQLIWIHHFMPETEVSLSECDAAGKLDPMSRKSQQSTGKLMGTLVK